MLYSLSFGGGVALAFARELSLMRGADDQRTIEAFFQRKRNFLRGRKPLFAPRAIRAEAIGAMLRVPGSKGSFEPFNQFVCTKLQTSPAPPTVRPNRLITSRALR